MSPSNFNVGNTTARELVLNSDGNVADWGTVTNSNGVRAELPIVISYLVLDGIILLLLRDNLISLIHLVCLRAFSMSVIRRRMRLLSIRTAM